MKMYKYPDPKNENSMKYFYKLEMEDEGYNAEKDVDFIEQQKIE